MGVFDGSCTYEGFGSSITGLFCNAGTGNLSADQVAAIKADAAAQVRRAAAGRQPEAVNVLVNQTMAEIDRALATFKLPGETGSSIGALPSQAGLRLPGTGVVDLAKLKDILPSLPDLTNLKWWILGAGLLVGAFYAFPYVAPGVAKNINAFRSLR